MAASTHIVIVGAGYTGIWAYRSIVWRLGGALKRGEVKLTVICPKDYHSFHGFTAEALCGILSVNNRQSPLRRVMRKAQLIRAQAEQVNLESKTVTVRHVVDGSTAEIPYDHLLLANGSYDLMDTVPGMRQYGWSLKEPGGVLSTRNHLLKMLDRADSTTDQALIDKALCVVVAGGGFAGVELAANIAEMYQSLRSLYPVLQKHKARVVLVHSGDKLIPQLRPRYAKLADYATRELEKYGVELRMNIRLAEVQADQAVLADGTIIPASTVISTIGQKTLIFPGTESLPHTADGLIIADEYLHVQGQTNIWAGGDAAQVMHISGTPCPANALWAIMHGVWGGDNLARSIQGKSLRKFTYWGLGQAASLGIGKGATELYTGQFTGWIGWILRFFFFIYFMPSRRQAVRILFDWFSLPFLGRYQTAMESVSPALLAEKRAKEPKATLEMPAITVE